MADVFDLELHEPRDDSDDSDDLQFESDDVSITIILNIFYFIILVINYAYKSWVEDFK